MAPKRITNAKQPFARKIMIYSPPGNGKTRLAGTAQAVPELRDVVVYNLDGGAKNTLRGAEHEGILLDEEARKAADVEKELWKIVQKAPGYENIKTVILDGVSEVAKAELADIQSEAARRGQRENADESQLRDFMIRQSRILRVCRMARDLPITVIMTAWSKDVFPKGIDKADPAARPSQIVPDFSGGVHGLGGTLMGYCDDVWYLHEKDGKRQLVTSSTGAITAKTRGEDFARELGSTRDGKFVPVLEEPTMVSIYAAFQRAYNKKESK